MEFTELNKMQLEKMIKVWNSKKLEILKKSKCEYSIESCKQEIENNLEIYKEIGYEDNEVYSDYVLKKMKEIEFGRKRSERIEKAKEYVKNMEHMLDNAYDDEISYDSTKYYEKEVDKLRYMLRSIGENDI